MESFSNDSLSLVEKESILVKSAKLNNHFVEPYDKIWLKIAGTICYLIQLVGAKALLTFFIFERRTTIVSYRTVLNQLTSWIYLDVSKNELEL